MSLPESLVDQSALTPRQLEALQSYVRVAAGEMKYKEAASVGPSRSVTIGSYFRTVKQARENVRKSIVTLLIGIWLGIVKTEDAKRLLDVAGRDVEVLSDEERNRLVGLLRVLVQKIVM